MSNEFDLNWSELFDSSDGEEEKFAEQSSESEEDKNYEDLPKDSNMEEEIVCKCFNFDHPVKVLNYLKDALSVEINQNILKCIISNIARGFNLLSESNVELNDKIRLCACDFFYRLRHELLFKVSAIALNLPQTKTDIPFNKFGIDSNRTPDLIIENNDCIVIIEVSASSSFEKAAMSKGLEEAGFESKYQKEIEMINSKGLKSIYIPLLFDMSNPNNMDYEMGFDKLPGWIKVNQSGKILLKSLKEYLCILSIQLRNYLMAPSSILFTKIERIKQKHDELSFLYEISDSNLSNCIYKEFCISPPVYNKVINNWHRLTDIITKSFPDDEKVILVLDSSSHRLFTTNVGGKYKVSDYLKVIEDNDKFNLFKMLKLKIGKGFVSAVDSNDGVKFIERTKEKHVNHFLKADILASHHPIDYFKSVDLNYTYYELLLKNYFEFNYSPIDVDDEFEERFINYITNNDNSQKYDSRLSDDRNPNKYNLSNLNLISDNKLDDLDLPMHFHELKDEQINLNKFDEAIPIKIQKNKIPFLLPLAQLTSDNYTSLNYKNSNFISTIADETELTDPYTHIIMKEIIDDSFEFLQDFKAPSEQYNKMKSEKQQVSREITKLSRTYYNQQNGKGNSSLRKCKEGPYFEEFRLLSNKIRDLSKKLDDRSKLEKIKNETQLIRLPTKNKNTALGLKFLKEMEHYKNKKVQSTITGIGYRDGIEADYTNDMKVYDNITKWLTESAGENPNLVIDDRVAEDVNLLKELKNLAMDEYKTLINTVKNSFLGHSASFISNLAHSLLYYSQMPFNSDYVRVDNLGMKDVLLIVRGGKKIFRSKASKMYRLIYPINESLLPWIESGKGMPSSTKIFNYEDNKYLITPWQSMHESTLNDSISFYTRIVSFVVLNLNPKIPLNMQFQKVSFNVLLAFHNRRHTEVMLANLRYILLATLGDFTGIISIFKEFLGFNYDCFQSFIRGCILIKYIEYFNNLKNVKNIKGKNPNFNDYVKQNPIHLFSGSKITTEEDLALMIYSTFLMTKAPYQRPAERARNLKGILDIHELFDKSIGLENDLQEFYDKTTVRLWSYGDIVTYSKAIFNNDFLFDPHYCSKLGEFADSYYLNKNLKEELFVKWNSILNQSWDELATSTGLRGKFEDLSNFWGQKGYFVVYKDLVNNKDYMYMVNKLMKTQMENDKKRKLLRELNVIYKVKIEEVNEYLLFHAVDKVQWRGGREIYVMDIDTKTVQQPIEKFMGFLCSKLDNELISIPSDRRAQVIHHSIFEKDLPMKETLTWYLTLDCSKWAPKSNYLKFISTILPMTAIPPTFKTHFLNYCQRLFKKRIYFNEIEVEVLKNNQIYSPIVEKYLKHDDARKGYYLLMPYSWVMGIFNYTSSFLHAINQKYSEYIIFKTGLISYSDETTLKMFAHSDDSGGRVSCRNEFMLTRCLSLYELQLKMCNHILSKKKSVVSRFYFEILSVIYIFKKLLALLPKFLGGLRFLPSDKGPAQDMLASYSKGVEVMVAGASFNLAYMVMKFYSAMIYRFYNHTKEISLTDYDSPVQYMGLPDAHPLMVLLCGSDSDIVRLMSIGKEGDLAFQHAIISKVINTIDDEGPIKPIKFNISVRGLKKGFEEYLEEFSEELKSWSISNVNFHSTPFNFLSFLKRLSDPGFVGSLVNESTTRRLSRAFFMRKGTCINSTLGVITKENFLDYKRILCNYQCLIEVIDQNILNDLKVEINDYLPISLKQIEVLKETLVSPLRICRYMKELSLKGKQMTQTSKTLKPTHIELLKSSRTFTCNFDPAQMVSYIKEPELSWALPNLQNLYTAKKEVENICTDLGFDLDQILPSTLLKLCRNYSNKHVKEIYLYSRIPGEIRNIKTYSAFLTFLSTNTFNDREIKGLVLNLRKNLTDPGYLSVNIDEDVYIINNILSIIQIFLRASSISFIKSLMLNPLPIIGWGGGSIDGLMGYIEHESKGLDSTHYNLQLNFIKNSLIDKFYGECSADFLDQCSYYYFPKTQKSKSGWFGSGKLVICIKNRFYKMSLYNNLVISLESNNFGKILKDDIAFITDVLNKSSLSFSNKKVDFDINRNFDLVFGLDYNGDYSISKKFEISVGIPAYYNPVVLTPTVNKDLYRIDYLTPNSFLLKSDVGMQNDRIKIYTLPLIQGEILNLIKMLFKPEYFEVKLLESGLNDFEDYVLTEIMVNFGYETYINPYDFFDNYQSSKLFQVFKDVKEKSLSKMPKKPESSILPANEGSLLRILIDYTNSTGEGIIKTPNNLTPEIMELRSQYPEHVSVILSENLVKYHNTIYNSSERMEIKEAYQKLYKYTNYEELQLNAIKLMTHWGYGSLVNSIENYTLTKNLSNFWYFSLDSFDKLNFTLSSDLFITMHSFITETMLEFASIIPSIEPPLQNYKIRGGDIYNFVAEFNTSIANNCYNNIMTFTLTNFNLLVFENTLIGLLEDENFVDSLNCKFDKDYILCSLEVSFKNRNLLIPLYNTLLYNFINVKGNCKELNYLRKVDRLEANVVSPKTIYDSLTPKKFKNEIFKYNVQYHNFLNDDFISYCKGSYNTFCNGINYRVSQEIKNKSDQIVRVCPALDLTYQFNPEIFNTEDWEEVDSTIEMGGAEKEDLDEYLENIPNRYLKPKTKRLDIKIPTIKCEITWVVDPFIMNNIKSINHYRQTGENLVIISTEILNEFLENFPNTHCRRVNFSRKLKRRTPEMILHISCNKALTLDFWDTFIGGTKLDFNQSINDVVFSDKLIIRKGFIGNVYSLGYNSEMLFGEEWVDSNEDDGKTDVKKDGKAGDTADLDKGKGKLEDIDGDKSDSVKDDIKPRNLEEYKNKVLYRVEEAFNKGIISRALRWRLVDKYIKNEAVTKVYSLEELFLNCMNEISLGSLNIDIKSNNLELNKNDYVRIFLTPDHFGVAQTFSRGDPKNIKNKKIMAEINSLNSNLASMVASGTLTVSKNFYSLILSNYKLWVSVTRGTKYKRENKKFILVLFLTILNSAKIFDSSPDDQIWQNMVNLITPYIADDGPIDDNDEDEFLDFDTNIIHGSRLLYKASGFN